MINAPHMPVVHVPLISVKTNKPWGILAFYGATIRDLTSDNCRAIVRALSAKGFTANDVFVACDDIVYARFNRIGRDSQGGKLPGQSLKKGRRR